LVLEDPMARPSLSVFDYRLRTWTEFVVLKAIVDLAEVVLMEDLSQTSYLPLRRLATQLLPEERFHVSFGKAHTRDLAERAETRDAVQEAATELIRFTLPFFGRSHSANNELFRRWGVKRWTNDETRSRFLDRTHSFVVDELDLEHPEVAVAWNG